MSKVTQVASMNKRPLGVGTVLKIAMVCAVLLGIGAAGGLAIGERSARSSSDRNQPHFMLRDGEVGEALPAGVIDAPADPSNVYRSTYFQFTEPFTLNLGKSGAIAVASLAISTLCDQIVVDNLKENETAVKSGIVGDLSATDEAALRTDDGRNSVRRHLVETINRILVEKTGYGGVDNVYITDLVTQ